MLSAKVIGNATATIKHDSLHGYKLLVVQPFMIDGVTPDGDPLVAIDLIGAGNGQSVILTSDGQFTRAIMNSETSPVRWTVLGVRDP
jgi:ethanolamine utilization protein EutN